MHDRTNLEGKRILVTGGTTGIGRATVSQLVREGARVLTFGRHQPELDAVLSEADGSGTVAGLIADVSTKRVSTRCLPRWTRHWAVSTCW